VFLTIVKMVILFRPIKFQNAHKNNILHAKKRLLSAFPWFQTIAGRLLLTELW